MALALRQAVRLILGALGSNSCALLLLDFLPLPLLLLLLLSFLLDCIFLPPFTLAFGVSLTSALTGLSVFRFLKEIFLFHYHQNHMYNHCYVPIFHRGPFPELL